MKYDNDYIRITKFVFVKKTVFLFAYLFMLFHAFGQDSILYRKGKSIPVQILSYDKERLYYKDFLDPEFGTKTEYLYKLNSIYYKDGGTKIVRNNLAKSFIGFSYGSSVPFSYYANNNYDNIRPSGHALTGGYGSIYAGAYVYKNFGLQFSYRSFNNPFNTSVKDVNQHFSNVSGSSYSSSNIISSISGDNWISHSLNIDLLYTFKFSRIFQLDVYTGVGIAKIKKPEFEVDYHIKSTDSTYKSGSDKASGAMILTSGLRFKYAFSRHLALCAGMDMMFADQQFNVSVERSLVPLSTSTSTKSLTSTTNIKWDQSISVVNFNIGMCYLFNRVLIK